MTPPAVNPHDQAIDDLVHAWARWARHPGHDPLAARVITALHAVAGPRSNQLRRHICDHLRERSSSIREAITTWLDLEETPAA